jgi:signal transduction histidine kinase
LAGSRDAGLAVRNLGLRTKLALGFVGLLAIFAVVGVESITLLGELGGSIDIILRENYKSVIACEQMKESLERMDSGALFALAGQAEQGRALAAEHRPRFEEALQTELGNITLPGEKERAERLRRLFGEFAPTLGTILREESPVEARRALYFEKLYPTFLQIKATADEILEMNQQNMVQANDRARKLAADAGRRMALLLIAGAVFAGVCVLFLSSVILRPLARLTWAAGQIARGDLEQTVPVTSRDELGQLGTAFNSMAAGLRELRETDQAQAVHLKQSAQVAIDSLAHTMAAVGAERSRASELYRRVLANAARDVEAARGDEARLGRVAKNLQAMASLEARRKPLHPELVTPRELVEHAVAPLGAPFADRRVTLAAEVAPDAPRVLADRDGAGFVLSSLLHNALAHSLSGGKVTVSAEKSDGRVRFTVADTGSGIPAEYRERIFEPFFQVPGTEDLGGVGLGLAVAKEIVLSHGGEIDFQSEEGRGATFWFTLPADLD